jgi:outer membrane immunogenic protein
MAAPANAADLPIAPSYKAPVAPAAPSWTGIYAGLGLGFRSSVSDPAATGIDSSLVPTSLAAFCDRFADTGGCVTSEPVNDTAFRISPYVGFNWQLSPLWVVGVEGDVGFADKKTILPGIEYPLTVLNVQSPKDSFAVKTNWDASLRARLGVLANPSLMFYVTGGPSWMHIESTATCNSDPATGFCSPAGGLQPAVITHSTDKLGWTAGGGAEALLSTNWFLRGEYRYSDYGTIGNVDVRTSALGTSTNAYDLHVRTHTATLGVAYRFWGEGNVQPAAALPAQTVRSWTGPYVGLGAGFRSSQTDVDVTAENFPCRIPRGCTSGEPFNDTAGRISPYVGWTWQFAPQWVAGLEGDFGFSSKTTTVSGLYYPNTLNGFNGAAADYFSVRTDWDASLRARLGYLLTSANLVYLTGGASWLRVDNTSVCSTNQFVGTCRPGVESPSVIAHSDTRLGWTIGGGLESRLWRNWLARAEYRYADYGRISHTDSRDILFIPDVEMVSYDTHIRTHTLTLGLAYQFDWANPAVAQ